MIRVLLIQNKISSYRIPIYNLLSEHVDLTVAYSMGDISSDTLLFKTTYIPIIKIGRFVLHKKNLYKLANQFDVVIGMNDISWLSIIFLSFIPRKFKLIYWGIGVTASYKNKFDTKTKWDVVRHYLCKRADSLIFYSEYPIEKYIKKGFNRDSLFVAHNTVQIEPTEKKDVVKNSIIFLGTLYKEKNIYPLLYSYKRVLDCGFNLPILRIIGDGEERKNIEEWIIFNSLSERIILHGAIFNEKELGILFSEAFACISPGQAGLTVLKSMGYGVPFITMFDAITGGERLNIQDRVNGLLMSSVEELDNVIEDIVKFPDKYINMGTAAAEYYNKYRTPQQMIRGFVEAIRYSLSTK